MSGEGNLSDKSSKIERRLGCSSDQVIDMPLPGLNIKTKKDKKRFIEGARRFGIYINPDRLMTDEEWEKRKRRVASRQLPGPEPGETSRGYISKYVSEIKNYFSSFINYFSRG